MTATDDARPRPIPVPDLPAMLVDELHGEWPRDADFSWPALAPGTVLAERDRDARLMRVALWEAVEAFARDEVPVGCIVVHRERGIIGRGFNLRETRHDPTAHAEIVAIHDAAQALGMWRLDECELFVTLEPCPMCAGALVNARIGRVIFGANDAKAGACGSVLSLHNHPVLNHRYDITRGVLGAACAEILSEFFRRKRRLGKK